MTNLLQRNPLKLGPGFQHTFKRDTFVSIMPTPALGLLSLESRTGALPQSASLFFFHEGRQDHYCIFSSDAGSGGDLVTARCQLKATGMVLGEGVAPAEMREIRGPGPTCAPATTVMSQFITIITERLGESTRPCYRGKAVSAQGMQEEEGDLYCYCGRAPKA